MYKVVLIRHGESVWNQENRFTGWKDVDLSAKGFQEAERAGDLLKAEGFHFDVAYTSVLKRALKTCWMILEELDLLWIPVEKSWHLNERHYGGLQGLNKIEMAQKHGEDQVYIWRRSYDVRPPQMSESDPDHPKHDPRYKNLKANEIPSGEALKDTVARVIPFWNDRIVRDIKAGKKVLIAAHGNSLRALIKHLDHISESDIAELNLPTAMPLVYELDQNLKPISKKFLGDPAEVAKAMSAVANQGKVK